MTNANLTFVRMGILMDGHAHMVLMWERLKKTPTVAFVWNALEAALIIMYRYINDLLPLKAEQEI